MANTVVALEHICIHLLKKIVAHHSLTTDMVLKLNLNSIEKRIDSFLEIHEDNGNCVLLNAAHDKISD